MILGQQSEVGQWTCPACGNVYNVFLTPSPDPTRASLNCDCGQPIIRGPGAADYKAVRIRTGDPADAASNPRLGE